MKISLENARTLVSDTEARLRTLIAEAATSGDYDAVRQLSSTAERLAVLRDELAGSSRPTPGGRFTNRCAQASTTRKRRRGRASAATKSVYPRFERRNEVLCKIGWSKKSRTEYEHKVSRPIYDHIVDALISLARNPNAVLTVDQIVEHLVSSDDADVSVYQVYIVLALLRRERLVEKRGREGYRVIGSNNLAAQARTVWEDVEESS